MAIFKIHHGGIVDICHDFSTQPFLIRSPLFREFIALLVLL